MATEIPGPTSDTASTTTNNITDHHSSRVNAHPSYHHAQFHQQQQDRLRRERQEQDNPYTICDNATPQLSRPASARIHDHHGHRPGPQWPYDHRRSQPGHCPNVLHNNFPSSSSLNSHGRPQHVLTRPTITIDDAQRMDTPPSSTMGALRIPSRATIRDSEKGHGSTSPVQHFSPVEPPRSSYSHIINHDLEAADEHENEQEYTKQTLRTLIHLALSAPFTSAAACIYTILVLIYVLLTIPFHLCSSDSSHSAAARVVRLLLQPLNLQRRCIFAPIISTPSVSLKAHTEGSTTILSHANDHYLPCKTSPLIFTHLLAPFVSVPLAFGAWCTALAWLPSAMLSHERTSGVTDDERRMAERLVGMWLRWLEWCVIDVEEEKRGRRRQRRAERGRR